MNANHELTFRMILDEKHMEDYQLLYVLKKEDGSLLAAAYDRQDPDGIVEITRGLNKEVEFIPDWDFSVNENFLKHMENGYSVAFVNLDVHRDLWNAIDGIRKEIYYPMGLQKYLSFCQKNDITSTALASLGLEKVDIMDLYRETNNGYEIIKSITVDQDTIVLGYSRTNPSPYVTWETNYNRSSGYRNGHYLLKMKNAQSDFEERSESLFKSKMEKLRPVYPEKKEEAR